MVPPAAVPEVPAPTVARGLRARASRRPRDPALRPGAAGSLALAVALALAAAGALAAPPGASQRWAFALAGGFAVRQPPRRHPHVGRNFFQPNMVNPGWWKKQMFVCETFQMLLPAEKPKAKLCVVEVEPSDAKYVAYLKPEDKSWYVDEYIAVGKNVFEDDKDKLDRIKKEAVAQGAAARFQPWLSPTQRWPMEKSIADMGLLSDGAITRLGAGWIEPALMEVKRVLKPAGRLYLVLTEEDEAVLGGHVAEGLVGSALDRAGFQLISARLDEEHQVVAGYAVKKMVRPGLTKPNKGFNQEQQIRRPDKGKLMDALGI